jgi:hypothetical protein
MTFKRFFLLKINIGFKTHRFYTAFEIIEKVAKHIIRKVKGQKWSNNQSEKLDSPIIFYIHDFFAKVLGTFLRFGIQHKSMLLNHATLLFLKDKFVLKIG